MTNAQDFAETQTKARDLRSQLADLENNDEQEMLFQEWSPGRKMVRLWSMIDGMEINIPRYMVAGALGKRRRDGRGWQFTADQSEAPTFTPGTVRCFLADDSPERESGLLAAAGLEHLEACPAKGLRSQFSKRTHAQNRHRLSWETLQEHLINEQTESARSDQRKQTEAMLKLAGMSSDEAQPTKAELIAEAEDRGVEIDKRWNKERIQQALEEV